MAVTIRWAVCLALVSSLTFSLWAAVGDARDSVQGVRRTTNQLRVAIAIPKSGSFKIHNRLIANGATVAAREINAGAAGGSAPVPLKLKVVSVRPTASPRHIVRGLVRASTRVLILPCNVELQTSLARAAARAGLLTLSPCNPDAKFGLRLSRYWPTGATGSALAQQLVFYAYYLYKHPKTAFLLGAAHSWYARQMIGELRAFAKRYKIEIVGQASVSGGSHGTARLAQRIRKANPTLIFAAVPSPTVESTITHLRGRGVTSPFFVTDGMDAAINFAGYRSGPNNSSLEDVVFATFGFPRPGPADARFLRDYAAAYRKPVPYSFPGLGYETAQILEAAARRARALTPAGLNASFAKGFTVKGAALEDTVYRGHGLRQPMTGVGIAQVIRDGYVPLFSSIAGHPTG